MKFGNKGWSLHKRSVVILSLSLMLAGSGCGNEAETNAESQSHRVSDSEICLARAEAKRAELGRPMPNIEDGLLDMYLGDVFVRVPQNYVISGGVPALSEPPLDYGKYIFLSVPFKDVEREARSDLDGVDGQLYIRLACAPGYITPERLAQEAAFSYENSFFMLPTSKAQKVPLPELGLNLYTPTPDSPTAGGDFVPIDKSFRNPQGGDHRIFCPTRRRDTFPIPCSVHLITASGFSGWYKFPARRLSQWREIHEFVTKFSVEMIQE